MDKSLARLPKETDREKNEITNIWNVIRNITMATPHMAPRDKTLPCVVCVCV